MAIAKSAAMITVPSRPPRQMTAHFKTLIAAPDPNKVSPRLELVSRSLQFKLTHENRGEWLVLDQLPRSLWTGRKLVHVFQEQGQRPNLLIGECARPGRHA